MTRDECPESRQGDSLANLFQDHADGLSGAVRGILGPKADVQEVLQDAFLKAWTALNKGFAPRNNVAWIFVVTMNLAKDQRRMRTRRQNHQPIEDTNPIELRADDPAPESGLEHAEAIAAARTAIHDLADKEREVFLMRTSAGLSFEAVGQALGIPVGTAKTRMRSALKRLRQKLAAFDPLPRHQTPAPELRPGRTT